MSAWRLVTLGTVCAALLALVLGPSKPLRSRVPPAREPAPAPLDPELQALLALPGPPVTRSPFDRVEGVDKRPCVDRDHEVEALLRDSARLPIEEIPRRLEELIANACPSARLDAASERVRGLATSMESLVSSIRGRDLDAARALRDAITSSYPEDHPLSVMALAVVAVGELVVGEPDATAAGLDASIALAQRWTDVGDGWRCMVEMTQVMGLSAAGRQAQAAELARRALARRSGEQLCGLARLWIVAAVAGDFEHMSADELIAIAAALDDVEGPSMAFYALMLAPALRRHDPREAVGLLRAALERTGGDLPTTSFFDELARSYEAMGQPEGALDAWRAAYESADAADARLVGARGRALIGYLRALRRAGDDGGTRADALELQLGQALLGAELIVQLQGDYTTQTWPFVMSALQALRDHAAYLQGLGRQDLALVMMRAVVSFEQERARDRITDLEGVRMRSLGLRDTTDLLISVAVERGESEARGWRTLALERMLAVHGRVRHEAGRVRPASAALEAQSTWLELRDRRARLARASVAGRFAAALGPAPDTSELAREVAELQSRLDLLLRREPVEEPDLDATTRALAAAPERAALVGFVMYRGVPWRADVTAGDLRVAAYTLDARGGVRWVDLGPRAAMAERVRALRGAIVARRDARAEGRALFDATLGRLPEVATHPRLFIVPDGELHLVPFAALTREDGRYLVESHTLSMLASPADIVPRAPQPARAPPLLLGGIDYESEPATLGSDPAMRTRADTGDRVFRALRHTGSEVTRIGETMQGARVLTGAAAGEQALRVESAGASILHIATHGYFFPARERDDEDPLLRGGLALAGANGRLRIERGDDGIMTSLEATGLDLVGTKLVVLSACETGLGDLDLGDGVHGLQSAFFEAGAETVVSSLWSVDDASTSDLMQAFYEQLRRGVPRVAALRAAQRTLGEGATGDARLAARPSQVTTGGAADELPPGGRDAPFYWAPFVVVGADGPIEVP